MSTHKECHVPQDRACPCSGLPAASHGRTVLCSSEPFRLSWAGVLRAQTFGLFCVEVRGLGRGSSGFSNMGSRSLQVWSRTGKAFQLAGVVSDAICSRQKRVKAVRDEAWEALDLQVSPQWSLLGFAS